MVSQDTSGLMTSSYLSEVLFNSSPSGQNGRHFAEAIFKRIFVNEKFRILIENFTEVCS